MCTKIAILHDHKIVDAGTPAELRKKYGKESLEKIFEIIEKK